MKTVNMGDKYTHRITLRLNDEQFEFVTSVSELLGVSPSDYVRMCINTGLVTQKKGMLINTVVTEEEAGTHEDVKADCNDKL